MASNGNNLSANTVRWLFGFVFGALLTLAGGAAALNGRLSGLAATTQAIEARVAKLEAALTTQSAENAETQRLLRRLLERHE